VIYNVHYFNLAWWGCPKQLQSQNWGLVTQFYGWDTIYLQ